ncbi:redoxin domain-containing protein [Arthrobacter sp. Br18]|uniref:redoxin domain-containing protein n=1 Tax=Arthrobacter sp. Br18 TaxID=1312954 RepID=UPI000479AC42|nr:redoxin domain-containing protein [Arthrobacter sp. Br18]
MAGLPLPGEPAPQFRLTNQFGESVTSEGLAGHGFALVFFPFAFSRVCSMEMAALQAQAALFLSYDVRILAVSTDHRYALRAWADAQGLRFTLLSDFWPHGAAARTFNVFDEQTGHAGRSTFFITSAGTVASVVQSPPGEGRRMADYARSLEAMAPA